MANKNVKQIIDVINHANSLKSQQTDKKSDSQKDQILQDLFKAYQFKLRESFADFVGSPRSDSTR